MRELKLTAEQAVCMARATASVVAEYGEPFADLWDDPQEIRDRYDAMTPYVGLIRELQDEIEVTRLDTLRDVAERFRREALEVVKYDQQNLTKLRAGDESVLCAETPEESERLTRRYMDERLEEAAIAGTVLERLEGVM